MQTYKISEALSGEEFEIPPIIGLTGFKGVGKSTLADKIGGKVISFSAPIKEMLQVIIPSRFLYKEKEEQIAGFPEGVTARLCLQTLGTEWGRAMYPDIWVNFAEIAILAYQIEARSKQISERIILDDVRFENECQMIKSHNGEIWRVVRSGVGSNDNYVSEAGIADEIVNKQILI